MQKPFSTEGYGPPGLVGIVRKCGKTSCYPNGFNFAGIDFKGYALTSTPDMLLPIKYRASFFEVPRGSGNEFEITGFQEPYFLDHLRADPSIPVVFANQIILESNNKIYHTAYRLILEEI